MGANPRGGRWGIDARSGASPFGDSAKSASVYRFINSSSEISVHQRFLLLGNSAVVARCVSGGTIDRVALPSSLRLTRRATKHSLVSSRQEQNVFCVWG